MSQSKEQEILSELNWQIYKIILAIEEGSIDLSNIKKMNDEVDKMITNLHL